MEYLRWVFDITVITLVSILGVYLGHLWYKVVERRGWRGWFIDG